jgi:methane/ammonia monooxygenase subunit B
MVEKKIFVIGLSVVLALGTLGFNWVESIVPTADAHGVQAQLQSRFIRIEDETFREIDTREQETNR